METGLRLIFECDDLVRLRVGEPGLFLDPSKAGMADSEKWNSC